MILEANDAQFLYEFVGDADDAAAARIVTEAADAAHQFIAAKPVVDAIDEMEADA